MYDKDKLGSEGCCTFSERQALANLNALLEESDPRDLVDMINLKSMLKQVDDPPKNTTTACNNPLLKNKSAMYPAPSSNYGIATFLKLTCQEIKALDISLNHQGNLTVSKKTALKNLFSNHNITIKPLGKGGNIILMDNDKYVLMRTKILSNGDWYRPIRTAIIDTFNEKFYLLVDSAFYNNAILKQLWNFVHITFPKNSYVLLSP